MDHVKHPRRNIFVVVCCVFGEQLCDKWRGTDLCSSLHVSTSLTLVGVPLPPAAHGIVFLEVQRRFYFQKRLSCVKTVIYEKATSARGTLLSEQADKTAVQGETAVERAGVTTEDL